MNSNKIPNIYCPPFLLNENLTIIKKIKNEVNYENYM